MKKTAEEILKPYVEKLFRHTEVVDKDNALLAMQKFGNQSKGLEWVEIIENDIDTYPKEGIDVLVSDGENYDVAYYIMSGEYRWVKFDLIEDDISDFKSFIVSKWAYID